MIAGGVFAFILLLVLAVGVVARPVFDPPLASDRPPSVLPDSRIDLNTAPAAELTLLPGIGPALAERIVADRAANGPFTSIDDLTRVFGIGERIVVRVRRHLIDPAENGDRPE